MDLTALHWEWRTFGARFGAADATFAAMEPKLVQESEEIYLLSPRTDAGVKIRADRVEIKRLEQVDEARLEKWWLAVSEPFPLLPGEVDEVCAALGVTARLAEGALSTDELLAALAVPERGVRTVADHKLRSHYSVNGCRVMATVRELGLAGRENISYPRWLKAGVGMERKEEDATHGQEQESEESQAGGRV
jgi:hypothetical protein